MASAVDCGVGTLRDITGLCDWCGDECHPNQEICVALSCQRCDSKIYHQTCVEKFLKKHGLASNRKTGFPCPFGKGKASSDECKGKVEKSHPIVPKNEEKKKARMAPQVLEAMAKQPKAPKPAAKPPAPKLPAMPRKMAPPKAHQLATVARTHVLAGAPAGVWGQKGAAPVLANAHLPAPEEPEPAAHGPRPAELPVGMVLEEAMTKAQKKNLARKKKRQAVGLETVSEASSEHQEAVAAATGAGPSSLAAAGGAAAGSLRGFDGSTFNAQNHMLEEQGHRFITDASKYAELLGLYVGDSDEEAYEEDGGEEVDAGSYNDEPEEQHAAYSAAADVAAAGDSNLTAFSPSTMPQAPSPPAAVTMQAAAPQAAAMVGKDVAGDEAAFNAAVTASIQQYQLEEEIRRQREVLANGFNGGLSSFNKPAPATYYPAVSNPPVPVAAPVAAPVLAPVVAPIVAPVVAPLAAPPPAATVMYSQTKQQPEVPAASYSTGWVFGGGNQGQAMPPHIPAAYTAPVYPPYDGYGAAAAQYGGGSVVGTMAAGHSAPEVAAEDDDDDLSTLLALCGVAG